MDLQYSNAFNKDWWRTAQGASIVKVATAAQWADVIYKARGLFGLGLLSSDSDVIGLFRTFKNWAQISETAEQFYKNHGNQDMFTYMQSFMKPADMEQIKDIVNSIPQIA